MEFRAPFTTGLLPPGIGGERDLCSKWLLFLASAKGGALIILLLVEKVV